MLPEHKHFQFSMSSLCGNVTFFPSFSSRFRNSSRRPTTFSHRCGPAVQSSTPSGAPPSTWCARTRPGKCLTSCPSRHSRTSRTRSASCCRPEYGTYARTSIEISKYGRYDPWASILRLPIPLGVLCTRSAFPLFQTGRCMTIVFGLVIILMRRCKWRRDGGTRVALQGPCKLVTS